ncbi:MAG TPA: hypothetical protein VH969_19740 [Actinophytocola sp.]|uniref:hypothetical protein n=1 Tax=Actinophytocola sp. TaxID=1872138 RepID=UPI002F925AEB
MATEVVLLWPRGVGSPATIDEAGLWPVFVLVVGDRQRADVPAAAPLLDLVNQHRQENELAVVAAGCRWSVVDARNALLKVTIQAQAPRRFEVEILVPARRVLGMLEVAARGATIGVTTTRQANNLGERVDIRQALHRVVLLSCEPSTELSRLARFLHSRLTPRGPKDI